MSRIIVKMIAGRTDEQKNKLAKEITQAVINITKNREESISISIEHINYKNWTGRVYKTDISTN